MASQTYYMRKLEFLLRVPATCALVSIGKGRNLKQSPSQIVIYVALRLFSKWLTLENIGPRTLAVYWDKKGIENV